MLQQRQEQREAEHQLRTQSSDSLRVTPEEVALASASLEEKRDAEHRWREETLPLEEAIQQLGLNATPDELKPEVEALRAKRAAQVKQERMQVSVQRSMHQVLIGLILALVVIVAVVAGMLIEYKHRLHAILHPSGALPIQSLSTVQENRPMHIDSGTLANLANLTVTPDQAVVDVRNGADEDARQNGAFNNEWAIVKSGGKIYVRVWTSADQVLEIANRQGAYVYSSRPLWMPAANLTMLQVPLYRFANINTNHTNTFDQLAADGKEDTAHSVLESDYILDADTAIKNLVDSKVYDLPGNISASAQDKTVTLGGNVDLKTRQHAWEIAKETIQKMGAPYQVSNNWHE